MNMTNRIKNVILDYTRISISNRLVMVIILIMASPPLPSILMTHPLVNKIAKAQISKLNQRTRHNHLVASNKLVQRDRAKSKGN